MRWVTAFLSVSLLAGTPALAQQQLPSTFTISLKFPAPKTTSYITHVTPHVADNQRGPLRMPRGPQFTFQPQYLRAKNLTYIPWQFSERNLGLPGYTPLQRIAMTGNLEQDLGLYQGMPVPKKLRVKSR